MIIFKIRVTMKKKQKKTNNAVFWQVKTLENNEWKHQEKLQGWN